MAHAARLANVHEGQRVYAYRNLTRRCWSLKALDGASKGKVVAHLDQLTLCDVTPSVSASGVRWARANGKRLVCGGLVGTYCGDVAMSQAGARLRFRPMTQDAFTGDDGRALVRAGFASFDTFGACHVIRPQWDRQ